MPRIVSRIQPCLWFDSQAEEAARFYVGIFPNSRILGVTHYGEAGKEEHGKPPGSVMTVSFVLDGQEMLALNGGPHFSPRRPPKVPHLWPPKLLHPAGGDLMH